MQDEASLWPALRRHAEDRAELGSPGHVEQIEIELAGLCFVLRGQRHGRREDDEEHCNESSDWLHVRRIPCGSHGILRPCRRKRGRISRCSARPARVHNLSTAKLPKSWAASLRNAAWA